MRRILFSLVILASLLLAIEVGVTLLSQYGMERALRSQYELPSSLEVSINSFPYLVSLARNHMSEVQLTMKDELQYQAGEGALDVIPYEGSVNLYDVELNMPALLAGRLEIRRISRQKAAMSFDISDLNKALGMDDGTLLIEKDDIYMQVDGIKTQYKVKVTSDNSLTIEPDAVSTGGTGSQSNPDYRDETIVFHDLPMGATLLNASINGGKVFVEISIPEWKGYL